MAEKKVPNLPVPFDEAKAANYKIHCNFYAKSGADGVYTFIAEVNGKSTTGGSFGKLLPAAATAEIRLRLIRVQVVEPDHLHLPDLLA